MQADFIWYLRRLTPRVSPMVMNVIILLGVVPTLDAQTHAGDGDGTVEVRGELKRWHKVTLDFQGPWASENASKLNPFLDYQFDVRFTHESGMPSYVVPGYFAADGDAAQTSATEGRVWRAHLSPDKTGVWNYEISFLRHRTAEGGVVGDGEPVLAYHGKQGSFTVVETDKDGRDFRGHGRLEYVGKRYLQFAWSGEYFLKAGPDAPETLLAYIDFDGTEPGRARQARSGEALPNQSLHAYAPHRQDWRTGDPTWQHDKGKGLIGALNYLAASGCNSISFLPYNAGGDGDNVWPFVARADKRHYDCSKLDQWQIVFDHASQLGLHLHFKLQENEMDDDRRGHEAADGTVPESLDGGKLGVERRLYCREMVARFGYQLAMLWNLGEENTQSPVEQREMAAYLRAIDPYPRNIVIHTFPDQQDKVYQQLLGDQSELTGASLQNSWDTAHQRTLTWLTRSAQAGRPWVVCNDEQNPASLGVPPDQGYQGFDGIARERSDASRQQASGYTRHDIRKFCLWGTLMAGGAGVEYYFGYQLPENDLVCEDFRSRDKAWADCRVALEFFQDNAIPIIDMNCHDELIGNPDHTNAKYCLAEPGQLYLVYLPRGGTTDLDLSNQQGEYSVRWFNPRAGGALQNSSIRQVEGGRAISIGTPPANQDEDWLVVVSRLPK